MPQTEARTRSPKTATVERREASVLRYWTRGASQAPGLPRHGGPNRVLSAAPVRLSALRPPLGGGDSISPPRAQSRRGNEYGCLTSEDVNVATGRVAALLSAFARPPPLRGRGSDDGETNQDGRGVCFVKKFSCEADPPPVRIRINTEPPSPARGEGKNGPGVPTAARARSPTMSRFTPLRWSAHRRYRRRPPRPAPCRRPRPSRGSPARCPTGARAAGLGP